MKTKNLMKKILSVALLAVFMFTMNLGMLDDFGVKEAKGDTTYKITINAPSNVSLEGNTYTAYKIFDATKATVGESVVYKLDDAFTDYTYDPAAEQTLQKYLEGLTEDTPENKAALDAFAKQLRADIKAPNGHGLNNARLNSQDTTAAVASNTATITGLAPGYYLIMDTTSPSNDKLIAACGLNTITGDRIIELKADQPTITKKITQINDESSIDTTAASAGVGDKVQFTITCTVPEMKGYDSYKFVVHDTMTNGLKTNEYEVPADLKVTLHPSSGSDSDTVITDKCTKTQGSVENGDTFTVTINNLKNIDTSVSAKAGDQIIITYTATVDKDANATAKEVNTARLEYSSNPYGSEMSTTPEQTVYVYDFDIDVNKYTGSNPADSEKKLSGAQFILSRAKSGGGTEYYKEVDGSSGKVTWVDSKENAGKFVTDENGNLTTKFAGLRVGTYTLEEVVAPTGYNLLESPITVIIALDPASNKVTYSYSDTNGEITELSSKSGTGIAYQIPVVNNAGAELPETGGIGTTIFYIVGGALMIGALVLLLTKKKMSSK